MEKKLVVVLLYELLHLSLSLECLLFFVLSSLRPKENGYATFSLATTLFLVCWLYCNLFYLENYLKNSCNFYNTFLRTHISQMASNKMNVEPISKLQLQIVRFFSWYYQIWKAKNCLPEENINSATEESFSYFSFRSLSFKLSQSWIAYVFHPREKQKRCYNKMNLNFAYYQK